jgi:Uma2 family endonuclease
MGHAAEHIRMTGEQFIRWDETQPLRREFVAGELIERVGAEDRHVTVAGNLGMRLRQHLAGTPCRVFMSDMKLHVAAADCYFYPDVMVTCSNTDRASPSIKTEAKLVVEVLSVSTAAFDRGEKFTAYRQVPTLEEYLVVDIDRRRADLHRKGADGLWVLHPTEAGQAVALASVDLTITADELFADIDPAPLNR